MLNHIGGILFERFGAVMWWWPQIYFSKMLPTDHRVRLGFTSFFFTIITFFLNEIYEFNYYYKCLRFNVSKVSGVIAVWLVFNCVFGYLWRQSTITKPHLLVFLVCCILPFGIQINIYYRLIQNVFRIKSWISFEKSKLNGQCANLTLWVW